MRVEKQGDRQPFEPWEGPAPAAASGGTAIPVTSSVTGPSPPVASSGDADESPGPTSGVPCRPSEATAEGIVGVRNVCTVELNHHNKRSAHFGTGFPIRNSLTVPNLNQQKPSKPSLRNLFANDRFANHNFHLH